MENFIVVDQRAHWSFEIKNVELVTSREYLTDARFSVSRHVRIINLCQSYRYQSFGYYVSLVAEARGHRAFPSVQTMQDLRSNRIIRILSDELDELIQSSLQKLKSTEFELSIYFGKNVAKHYGKLALQIYNLFQSPLLRAKFSRNRNKWILHEVSTIALKDVPDAHKDDLINFANEYFNKGFSRPKAKKSSAYDLAILYNSEEKFLPSNEKAIRSFIKAGLSTGLKIQLIGKNDFNKLPFFDALFIRETTAVNHYTYRFARRAMSEGLVVIDDPESIIKCTNKVYLAELFAHKHIPCPETLIIQKENVDFVKKELGFPCVLKLPDGAFSRSVIKIENVDMLKEFLKSYFLHSDLLIAQEFMPTDYDWRIGVLNNHPIFACKYYMADKHWQIYNWEQTDQNDLSGNFETIPISDVPPAVLRTAIGATRLIGDGLYGVDLKKIGSRVCVIEINDNPNIDYGIEDQVLGQELYVYIMRHFYKKIFEKKHGI